MIKYFEMFDTEKKLYLIMELANGGELFDKVVAGEPQHVRNIPVVPSGDTGKTLLSPKSVIFNRVCSS